MVCLISTLSGYTNIWLDDVVLSASPGDAKRGTAGGLTAQLGWLARLQLKVLRRDGDPRRLAYRRGQLLPRSPAG